MLFFIFSCCCYCYMYYCIIVFLLFFLPSSSSSSSPHHLIFLMIINTTRQRRVKTLLANFNQPLAFAQHCSLVPISRLAATDQVQKQRGMNFEKYPWLRDLSNPSDIPFFESKAGTGGKGVTTIPNFVTREALEYMRRESVEPSDAAV